MSHITVLKAEAVDALSLTEDSVVIDCTLGAGGHADTILQKLGTNGIYVGIDADASAVEAAKEHFASVSAHTHFVTANFKDIVSVVAKLGIPAPTAILADLGWRSDQFESG
ncbi:16S rRNA (cytosine(1402)-N(4))-methyltransferase, partial [Candidatus Kaiserbacteria bacterium]|nr:16S rRNA (cytosine(1402)-N(4))-methyltransferase [Candidatus Kaiserbacteria bacterium]